MMSKIVGLIIMIQSILGKQKPYIEKTILPDSLKGKVSVKIYKAEFKKYLEWAKLFQGNIGYIAL